MAFNTFGNAGAGGVSQGPTLPEVQTEGLGFLSLAGDAKLRLSTPWSPPPSPTASLLSIASRRGLVAAAGPDSVVLASTDAVRKAFETPKDGDSDIRPFTPQLRLPLPIRLSQLAFSADEAYLVLSAEQGGGLAVYDVNALQQGATQSAFEIPTNSEPLRALVPNPSLEKAELYAVVTSEGKLLMANLKERGFVSGGGNQILKERVSCVAWSNKGKQLVAGLGDGTMCQLTPDGTVKAEIPRPPELDPSYYVSTVVWLNNDLFLVFHVSVSNGPQTKCHLITRQDQTFQYQGLNDPVDAYNAEKTPHHTALRLKDFPPNLQDLLIFCSSAVPDIGLLARSSTPLSPDGPVNVYTNIELADDSKRAVLPMGEDIGNFEAPAAIGASLDLSSKDKVYKPIPTDEQDESPGPLPGCWVLNESGILSIWWIVYSESIRGGTTYPGLAAVGDGSPGSASTQAPTPKATQPRSFGTPNASPFGSALASTTPTFGGPSVPGARSSPWGAAPATNNAIGGTAFGSAGLGRSGAAGTSAPVFGTSSFGMEDTATKTSPWSSAGASAKAPSFGRSGFADASSGTANPFGGALSSNTTSGQGFSSFANQGGFAALGPTTSTDKPSIFASSRPTTGEAVMDTGTNTSFPPPSSRLGTNTGSLFGSQPFKLTSSFKPETNTQDSDAINSPMKEKSLFGTGFVSSINEAEKTTNSIFGGGQGSFEKSTSNANAESTTPTSTPSANKFFSQVPSVPAKTGLFGLPSTSSGSIFGKPATKAPVAELLQPQEVAPAETPLPPEPINNAGIKSPLQGAEDLPLPLDSPISPTRPKEITTQNDAAIPSAAPLPPDPVKNKVAYSTPLLPLPGEAIKSKTTSDAPLPPDPIKNKKVYANKLPPLPGALTETEPASDAPLPLDPVGEPEVYKNKLSALSVVKQSSEVAGPGFKFPTTLPPVSDSEDEELADEFTEAASEGSGVDVANDLSPSSTGVNRTPGFTPQGSFEGGLGESYSTISRPEPERRSLFLGQNPPVFPQPNPVSPRSPSPVRGSLPPRILGNDQSRSFSAPGMASQILAASRKQAQSRPTGSTAGRDAALETVVLEQQRKDMAKKEAEQAQMLVDEEDDAVQKFLNRELEPTLNLDEFVAYSRVVPPAGDSVPAQVEAVYRDINSMIDTLGLNVRSLKAWTAGQEKFSLDHCSTHDLGSFNGWTLQGIEQLTHIIGQVLGEALDEARVTDVEEKVAHIQGVQRELARDCNKQADLRKIIASRLDPEHAAAYQALPLSAEQAAQQSDLRRQLSHFQTLLAQAEENLTLLKAKIVSVNSVSGRGGPVPTIEAIMRTITKMTSMAEKRSGDIDVLENQMRKLRLGSTGPPGSREGSPFATPNAKRTLGSSIFSPDRSTREATPMRGSFMRHSLSGSVLGTGGDVFRTPPRKKLSGFAETEKRAVKEKREKRAAILGKLRNSIQAKGPSVVALDDIV
ncbi:putative nuclear pore complex subunit [Rosellinia necatrix]|uniref:Putative nuclear pore complex subunit n=1 Tax=Rosellinia necatrix TaxID=77044 RepID=A0A1W2TPI4_ROSNE|nr:putative nuclear pore complex subunit [Rosellinia necatrix]